MPIQEPHGRNIPILKAVIPAAGLGTRLQPLTRAFPKELLPVGRQPVLAHIAAELRQAGIREFLFVVSDRKPEIRAFFGERYSEPTAPGEVEQEPVRCSYIVQERQCGLGDALLCAREWVGKDPFVVAFGDCIIESEPPAAPLRRLIATHRMQGASATALVESVDPRKVSRYGVLDPEAPLSSPDVPFAARSIVEKPSPESAPSNLVVAARWVLDPKVFAYLEASAADARGEINMTDAVRAMRQAGHSLWAVPLLPGERRSDIGSFESFFVAFVRAALHDPEIGAEVRRAAVEVLAEFD